MNFSSIRFRVLILGLLPALLAIFALSLVYITARLPAVEQSLNTRALAVARTLAFASEYAVVADDANQLEPILASAFETEEIVAVRIFRADESLLVERLRPRQTAENKPREQLLQNLLFKNDRVTTHRVSIYSTPIDAGFGLSAANDGRHREIAGYLDIEINLLDTTRNQSAIISDALITGLTLFLLSIPFVIWLGRSITRPLLSLSDTVDALTRGDYRQRAMFHARGEELRVLRDGINRMARHIQNEQEHLHHKVREATEDLKQTVSELHAKTLEANQQREAAERASEFKSRLVANVSHEIRTPLNAILGFADLLERQSNDPHQQQRLATLQRSAGNLLNLVNDLLDFSRLESGNMPWELVDMDINQLLNDLRSEFTPQTQEKGIEYFVRPLPAEIAQVRGDPTRLRQALVNLVSNAIKFTERGHVMLDAEAEQLDSTTVRLTFRVIDTGIGIDNNQLQLLFTAFAQGDMSINRRFGGTGLGLHIFSEIIALMNGEIIAHGTPGLGSVFGFRAELELCDSPQSQTVLAPAGTGTIALFSSYQPFHQATLELLRSTGHRVLDGKAGEAIDEHVDISIVCFAARELNELHLPPAGQFRQRPGQRVIAGIYTADELAYEQLDYLGYDGTLIKAMSPAELQNCLQSLLAPDHLPMLRPQQAIKGIEHHGALTVLVVDDQEINLRLMDEYLRLLGSNADCMTSGNDALERCKTVCYDLILLDLHMPELDGLAITRELRAQPGPNQHTPILAVTADSHPKRQQQIRVAGFQALLVKPVSITALDTAIGTWCSVSERALRTPNSNTPLNRSDTGEELLALLLRDLPSQRNKLLAAAREKNAAVLYEIAHALDGNARYCPTPELQCAAAALANVSANGWSAEVDTLMAQLDKQIERVIHENTATSDN